MAKFVEAPKGMGICEAWDDRGGPRCPRCDNIITTLTTKSQATVIGEVDYDEGCNNLVITKDEQIRHNFDELEDDPNMIYLCPSCNAPLFDNFDDAFSFLEEDN